MTDTITLEGVTLWYPFTAVPSKGFGGKGLFFEVTAGLTQEHVDQLIAEGVSDTVTNPKLLQGAKSAEDLQKAIMPRFRSKYIKRADTTLDLACTFKRKAKDANKEYTEVASEAVNEIRVEGIEEGQLIGDGTVADVTILLQRTESGTNMHIGSIKVTELKEYKKAEEDASPSDVDSARAKIMNGA
jgi:hypothetical protein